MNEVCPKCGCAPIPGCNGRGYFRVNDTTVRLCRNMYAKQLATHLGDEIANAKHVTESPLYKLGSPGEPPEIDRTGDNLVLRVNTWPGLLPHLKWALGCKGLDFRFKVLDDLEVVNVKVGATSRSSKGVARAEDGDGVYNHLGDLIEDYALIILKAGRLGYKNRAASGALHEFFLIRESQRKPTWFVIDRDHPWDHMNPETQDYGYSYSTAVEAHLDRWFEEIQVPSVDPGEKVRLRADSHIIVEDEDEDEDYFNNGEVKKTPVQQKEARVQRESEVDLGDLDNILPGENSFPKKNKWRRR